MMSGLPRAVAFGVEAQGHRGAGAKRSRPQVVTGRPGVETADIDWLVIQEPMVAHDDVVHEGALPGLSDHNQGAGGRGKRGRVLVGDQPLSPTGDDTGREVASGPRLRRWSVPARPRKLFGCRVAA